MSKTIPLNRDKVAIVDDDMYDYLNQWKWSLHKKERWTDYAHRSVTIDSVKRYVLMHRAIMNAPDGVFVDHINGNGLDNRRCNLRFCNISQNGANRKIQKNNTSGYRGVSWHKSTRRWQVQITFRGKNINFGTFKTPEEAARIYDQKAQELFGEFARLNFPG